MSSTILPSYLIFWLSSIIAICTAHAHIIDQVYAELKTEGKNFHITIIIDAGYCLPEYRGDRDAPAPDSAWINALNEEEHANLRKEAENYLRNTLTLTQGNKELLYDFTFLDYEKRPYKFYESMFGTPTLRIELKGQYLASGGEISASWQDPYEAALLFVVKTHSDGRPQNLSIHLEPRSQKTLGIHIAPYEKYTTSQAAPPNEAIASEPKVRITSKPTAWLNFVQVGFNHVVPKGLDHILFIFGLFLFSPKWKPLFHQSLVFTLSHSVTLALSLLGIIGFAGKWIEALIALSIVYIAIENIRTKPDESAPWKRLTLVFIFGLIHGLGFGSILRSFLPSNEALLPIVGFNLGVELGQIAVLVLSFLLFGWFSKNFKWIRLPGSIIIGLVGLAWTFERVFS